MQPNKIESVVSAVRKQVLVETHRHSGATVSRAERHSCGVHHEDELSVTAAASVSCRFLSAAFSRPP